MTRNLLYLIMLVALCGETLCSAQCFDADIAYSESFNQVGGILSAYHCQSLCRATQECNFFTWESDTKICKLIDINSPTSNPRTDSVSGPAFCTTLCYQDSVDYLGHDIFPSVPDRPKTNSAEECQQLCLRNQHCEFFTWHGNTRDQPPEHDNVCNLKFASAPSNRAKGEGLVSGPKQCNKDETFSCDNWVTYQVTSQSSQALRTSISEIKPKSNMWRFISPNSPSKELRIIDESPEGAFGYWTTNATNPIMCSADSGQSWAMINHRNLFMFENCAHGVGTHICGVGGGWILWHYPHTLDESGEHPCFVDSQELTVLQYCQAPTPTPSPPVCSFPRQLWHDDNKQTYFQIVDEASGGSLCVEIDSANNFALLKIAPCNVNEPLQQFYFVDGRLKNRVSCGCVDTFDHVGGNGPRNVLGAAPCELGKSSQQFYFGVSHQPILRLAQEQNCLQVQGGILFVAPCALGGSQNFRLECVNPSGLECRRSCADCSDESPLALPLTTLTYNIEGDGIDGIGNGCVKEVEGNMVVILACTHSSPLQQFHLDAQNRLVNALTGNCLTVNVPAPSGTGQVHFMAASQCVDNNQAQQFYVDDSVPSGPQIRNVLSENCMYNHVGRLANADCIDHGGVGKFNLVAFAHKHVDRPCNLDSECLNGECGTFEDTFSYPDAYQKDRCTSRVLTKSQFSRALDSTFPSYRFTEEMIFPGNIVGNIPGQILPTIDRYVGLKSINFQNGKELFGAIPSQLGHLKTLTSINMINNKLSSSIPTQIGNLVELTELMLAYNELTGEIPVQIGSLTKLQRLYLGNLDVLVFQVITDAVAAGLLSGFNPDEALVNFAALLLSFLFGGINLPSDGGISAFDVPDGVDLLVDGNKLTGTIPTEIGLLEELIWLDFSNNFGISTKIPSQIGGLTNLKGFGITNTYVSGSIPSQIGQLNKMQYLAIFNHIDLVGPIPTQIGNLVNLEVLFLHANSLNGHIPTQVGNLQSLIHMTMNLNELSGVIPSEIQNLPSLRDLILNRNQLTGGIFPEIATMTNLEVVTLGYNKFDLVCDCTFLSWYPEFSLIVDDKYDINPCSDINEYGGTYPFLLDLDVQAPCSHVLIDEDNVETNARDFTFRWEYPIENELVTIQDTIVSPEFRTCDSGGRKYFHETWVADGTEYQRSGFEIIWENEDGARVDVNVRECYWAWELEVLDSPISNLVAEFTIDNLVPATQNEVFIRPFHVYFVRLDPTVDPNSKFVYGARSKLKAVTTADDRPESPPLNILSPNAGANDITLIWDEPDQQFANGEITEYQVSCISENCPQQSIYQTDKRQIQIPGLASETFYQFVVRARTSATEFSSVASNALTTGTCPDDMKRTTTLNTDCFAERGSFKLSGSQEALDCEVELSEELTVGSCFDEGLTVETLNIQAGYWRPNISDHTEVRRCPKPNFCNKANAQLFQNSSEDSGSGRRRISSIEPEALQCELHHRGTYCFACEDGYALSQSTEECVECTDEVTSTHQRNLGFFFAFVSVIILLCLLWILYRARRDSFKKFSCPDIKSLSNFWDAISIKIRILESFLQVLFAFQTILYVESKNDVFTRIASFFANFDLGEIAYGFRLECAIDLNHYAELLLYTIPPILLLVLVSGLYKAFTRRSTNVAWKEEMQQECLNMFFIVTFLVYPGASRVIFDTFYCEDFFTVTGEEDGTGIYKSALRADYRVSCADTGERIGWLVYASLMVLIFPIGILGVYTYFLWKYHHTKSEKYEYLIRDLKFPYKDDRFWFEAYELVRKLLQTSFVSFCVVFGNQAPDSVALNISWICLAGLIYLDPYEKKTDFIFALLSMTFLIFATQLNFWFEKENRNIDQRIGKISDAFTYMTILELVVMFLLTIVDIIFSKKTQETEEGSREVAVRDEPFSVKVEDTL